MWPRSTVTSGEPRWTSIIISFNTAANSQPSPVISRTYFTYCYCWFHSSCFWVLNVNQNTSQTDRRTDRQTEGHGEGETFTEMSQKLVDVVDMTEIFYVMTNERRHSALINAETTTNTHRHRHTHTHWHIQTHTDWPQTQQHLTDKTGSPGLQQLNGATVWWKTWTVLINPSMRWTDGQ